MLGPSLRRRSASLVPVDDVRGQAFHRPARTVAFTRRRLVTVCDHGPRLDEVTGRDSRVAGKEVFVDGGQQPCAKRRGDETGTRSLAIGARGWPARAAPVRCESLVTIGGGGSPRTDCLLVLQAPANDPPDRPKKVTCFDGDPSCDHDGTVNGVCEFQVAACANSTFNPDRCTATGVASVTVDHAVDNANDPKFDTEFQALQSRIDSRFELPTETQDLCTSPTLRAG